MLPSIFISFIALQTCITSMLLTYGTAGGIFSMHIACEDDAVYLMIRGSFEVFCTGVDGPSSTTSKAAAPWSLPFNVRMSLTSQLPSSVWTIVVAFQSVNNTHYA